MDWLKSLKGPWLEIGVPMLKGAVEIALPAGLGTYGMSATIRALRRARATIRE